MKWRETEKKKKKRLDKEALCERLIWIQNYVKTLDKVFEEKLRE